MITKETATVVAKWWRNQLEHPTKDMGTEEHGGNDLASILGLMLAHKSSVTEDQLDKFEETLTELIMKDNVRNLGCDYHLDPILSEAAQVAGISSDRFPWKSMTRITDDGKVKAKLGYEGSINVIYDTEIEARKVEVDYQW